MKLLPTEKTIECTQEEMEQFKTYCTLVGEYNELDVSMFFSFWQHSYKKMLPGRNYTLYHYKLRSLRHPVRVPIGISKIKKLLTEFIELHGDI